MSEVERTRKLREENAEQKERIYRLEMALLNRDAIEQTLKSVNESYEKVMERLNRAEARIGTLDGKLVQQQSQIAKSLQIKYGTGPTG